MSEMTRSELVAACNRIRRSVASVLCDRTTVEMHVAEWIDKIIAALQDADRLEAEVERLNGEVVRLRGGDEVQEVECPDCWKDWGHGYCGTCGGRGVVRRGKQP